MNYYLRAGDALYRKETSAYGILIKKKGKKWYYSLRSPSIVDNETYIVGEYSVRSKLLYANIDQGFLEIFYGSKKNRRVRK